MVPRMPTSALPAARAGQKDNPAAGALQFLIALLGGAPQWRAPLFRLQPHAAAPENSAVAGSLLARIAWIHGAGVSARTWKPTAADGDYCSAAGAYRIHCIHLRSPR
jgi:hypothetical protein